MATYPARNDSPWDVTLKAYIDSFVPQTQSASTTAKGIVELATVAEASAGTDETRAVTPAGIANALVSANPAIAAAAAELAATDAGLTRVDFVPETGDRWVGFHRPDDTLHVQPLGGASYDENPEWEHLVVTEAVFGGPQVFRGGVRRAEGGRTTYEDTFGTRLTSDQTIDIKGDSIARFWFPYMVTAMAARNYKGRVRNWAVGGENTPTILARTGGSPFLATVTGGSIPASGPVTVNLTDCYGLTATVTNANTPRLNPLAQANNGFNPCVLTGTNGVQVEGVLIGSGSTGENPFTFTRLKAGAAVPAKIPLPLRTWASRNTMSGLQLIAVGQNDNNDLIGDDLTFTERFDQTQNFLDCMTAGRRRYVIITPFSGGPSTRLTEETEATRRWGRHAFIARTWLSSYAALDAGGVTPTAQDDADVTAGVVPSSFFNVGDTVHPNPAGLTALVQGIVNRLVELEYI